ncbi:MAG: tetratricopeptide repeat protein [Bacteroidetes bacterium]|nr:tetratricopeptide repeat protein [Bacteroidota bacterium]
MKRKLFSFIFLTLTTFCFAQKADSLFRIFKNASFKDTVRLNALNDCGVILAGTDPDSAIKLSKSYYTFAKSKNQVKHMAKALMLEGMCNIYLGDNKTAKAAYKKALILGREINDQRICASAYSNIGVSHYNTSDYDSALIYANKALDIRRKINDVSGISACYNNIANAYLTLSNYNQALVYYLMSLKLYEASKNETEIAKAYNNIGNLYNMQKRYTTAEEYYLKAIAIRKRTNDLNGLSTCYSNLGIIESCLKNMPKAIEYYKKSIEISKKISDYNGLVIAYGSLGDVYKDLGQYALAHEYIESSMELSIKTDDNYAIAANYNSLADIAVLEGKFALAIDLSKKALKINTDENIVDGIRLNYQSLANASSALHDYKNAFDYYVKYKELTDSIFNLDNSKMLSDAKTQYEVDKKATELKIKAEAEKDKMNVIAKEEKRRNVLIIFSVSGILLVVLIFSVFLYKRFKVTQKQKQIIETQKVVVEEKNKEITDSITYAKRLQNAILPPLSLINNNIKENFVFYKPKDIVAGDFYWATEHNNKFYLAVCDSTGHGVPGAFMSILNSNFLNEAIKEKNIDSPDKIFNHVRECLINSIGSEGQQDGMDGILICIDKQTIRSGEGIKITYAAANNEPILISNGAIINFEKDKMPIGKGERRDDFRLFTKELKANDCLYLYTDGYADQFGGPDGKKFKYKPLNEFLRSISNLPMSEQNKRLEQKLGEWRGNLEQVDDICIVGIRI